MQKKIIGVVGSGLSSLACVSRLINDPKVSIIIKMQLMKNQIKKILELLNHRIYVQKLLNIQAKMKLLYVI